MSISTIVLDSNEYIFGLAELEKQSIDLLSLVQKYRRDLPPEDAVIAAYCEFLKVDALISENRHFLVNFHPKSFVVLSAKQFNNSSTKE